MHTTFAISVLLICECTTIRVPVAWDNGVHSEVQNENQKQKDQFSVEVFQPKEEKKPNIPVEYFEYPAKKPQFAIDIAKHHGVNNPEQHFKAQPVKPYTAQLQPQLGIHHMLDEDRNVFNPYQKYVKKIGSTPASLGQVTPVLSNYEVYHPYKAEEPALQAIYKDPTLAKIRNDLENSKNRLQNYEKQAGESDISKNEYLEGQKQTDKKLFPQRNIPVQFEIHRPQRKPVYYRPPQKFNQREKNLNKRLRHPWNQNFVKIQPVHYRPLQNHIHNLRQQHTMKFDDERNEYPQVQVAQDFAEPQEGYDIYEKGKEKYEKLRNNVDESINKVVLENRPQTYHNLEMQQQNHEPEEQNDGDDEFVPIKNYAQVRKTETFKHLPRAAAFADAETLDEIQNAPRLREAVKSTKAQTVYTEEGYEDSAYDHAGEQKHASDIEAHGGYLKEKEKSEGKFKIPSVSGSFDDSKGSEYKDLVLHGKKWKDDNKDKNEESEAEDYSQIEEEQSVEADVYAGNPGSKEKILRNKRNNDQNSTEQLTLNTADKESIRNLNTTENSDEDVDMKKYRNTDHELDKREINFKVPDFDFDSTLLSEEDILKMAKIKIEPKKDELNEKYPYYFKNINSISKHSPLKYAENLKLIPKKSKGGTEFYDSRSGLDCAEVDDVDPLPEKLKNGENPTESNEDDDDEMRSNKGEKNFDTIKEQPRLRGLGDKIDCFKAKYFGENPLDSPFFKEEIIANPEPVTAPNLHIYRLKNSKEKTAQEATNVINVTEKYSPKTKSDIYILLDKLRNSAEGSKILNETHVDSKYLLQNVTSNTNTTHLDNQSRIYADVLNNMMNKTSNVTSHVTNDFQINSSDIISKEQNLPEVNVKYQFFKNKEDVAKKTLKLRKRRAATFVYEPYKIIRDSQVQDSKKTTTTSNVSPLIKQLQSSRVVDKVGKDKEYDKPVKRYVSTRAYKDIGKNDRDTTNHSQDSTVPTFIDVNVDQRRGEPRYEMRPKNHKDEYTPVENKKSMTLEDYQLQTNVNNSMQNMAADNKKNKNTVSKTRRHSQQPKITTRPVFDVSHYIPTSNADENVAASKTVRRFISTTTPSSKIEDEDKPHSESEEDNDSEEDYDEYDDEEEDVSSTTTTTTAKPTTRRRSRGTTTTTTEESYITTTEAPRLRLVTRFRNYNADKTIAPKETQSEKQKPQSRNKSNVEEDIEVFAPKYREKKKKTTKSTLVTDTKKYGAGEDDMRKEEVDALIGIKQDMDDYMPAYEKNTESNEKDDNSSEESDEEFDEEEDEEENINDSVEEDDETHEPTTPEPTKRTLLKTTDAPTPTIASRSSKPEIKPVISRKKIEIHKELPMNKSSPHITQFKQDIKEVEIIREIPPRKKQQKNTEALELYKDDNLAKEINKLGDVEVFKENLDLVNGPKHGGNYRSIEDATELPVESILAKDALASQSENTKHIELDDYTPKRMHGGNFKSESDIRRSRNSGRSAKYTELKDTESKPRTMHGGNLRYDRQPRRGNGRSGKLIELSDKDNDRSKQDDDDYKSYGSRTGQMHGGNYRSSKLVAADDIEVKKNSRDASKRGAVLLNSFAQAIPVLTTTPAYILDPSKRMYYYVEA